MNNQQVAPSELYSTKITVFYKQFTPNGAISVPSGQTVCRKSESRPKQAPEERTVSMCHKH
ncbi:MAG: hypothetical protein PHC28_00610 [Flavobacterium sp.]|uniref:hypothetical protein n=1 Tax=Flavobacterium sp. TaxID=239 RepID=UPI002608F320|nr:hypothetical protein [Flavobacterium sp.]MDD5148968.1 hypothetical protein [Flavobacterium sp.]